MAYAALASLAQTIDRIFTHNTYYSFSVRCAEQIVATHEYAVFLQDFLENFPEKAKDLEGRLRKLAYEAEDVLENLMWLETHSRINVEFEHDPSEYEQKLRTIVDQIDSIAGEVLEIKKSVITEDAQFEGAAAASSPSSKDVIVGFDEDLLAVKGRLCGGSSKLQVIPIVGMAGIGKTTLSRNAYNDPYVLEYFDIRAWVTVTQDYSAEEIISSLLPPTKSSIGEGSEQRNRELQVYQSLKGRRYLIVMDDMWTTEAWDIVRNVFPDDNNGSRIILTTRLSQIAVYAGPYSSAHEMLFMDVDQSWNLLRQRVFANQDCPQELEEIGKMIAGKCKGLPLAIVAVAGVLSVASKTPTSWYEVARKVNSTVTADDEQIYEILSLSYNQLPHYLRPCFLYMGCFREDDEIRVSKLIRLWVAEGFLKCENEDKKSLEEEAEDCLENLVTRNLVLVGKRRSNGKIKSCSLHDLMREICIRKAKEEEFLVHADRNSSVRQRSRRLAILIDDPFRCSNFSNSSLHTAIVISPWRFVDVRMNLKSVRLLRVLDSGPLLIDNLLEQYHLRYLAVHSDIHVEFENTSSMWNSRYLAVRANTSSMWNLQNLQTLIIGDGECWRTLGIHDKSLPQEFWTMQQLRHLVFFGSLCNPNGGTSPLQKLQTLTLISYYSCTVSRLKMVPNVKKLGVCCSDYEPFHSHLKNLVYLQQLQNLTLHAQNMLDLDKYKITFPKTLRKLSLDGFFIPWEDFTVVGSLPNLQVLKLRCGPWGKGTRTWETNEGEFLQLEFLLIDTPYLMYWISECDHFPKLKSLLLHNCFSLSDIPQDVGEIPTLELIEVKESGTINHLGKIARRIQEEQKELSNDSLQVRIITE